MGTNRRNDVNFDERNRLRSASRRLKDRWSRQIPVPSSLSSSELNRTWISELRKKLLWLVRRNEFDAFMTFCIVANTVVMATEHHTMSSLLEAIISVSNYVSFFFLSCSAALLLYHVTQAVARTKTVKISLICEAISQHNSKLVLKFQKVIKK